MEDPQAFLESLRGKRVVLDEVHRLANPSELLKIAADHFPKIKIIATGSSTLQASAKFRDALTGRKAEIWLTPMMSQDLQDFHNEDMPHRLLAGGLPPFFLSKHSAEKDFQEWIDSYWAKDIQELFRLEKHWSFQRFAELLLVNSGGIFEATKYAEPCEISRSTVTNYLNVMEATWVAHVIRPYSTHQPTEIISAPKVYTFDTGFVCYYKGWQQLRPDDMGILWEHYVLNEIHAHSRQLRVNYWRDKRGHEIDFILARGNRDPIAIECKWSANNFNTRNIRSFRRRYPEGENWIVAHDIDQPYRRRVDDLELRFIGTPDLLKGLQRMMNGAG
jgi:predicted AAA+ superfamily ATPase